MPRVVNSAGMSLIKRFEGLSLKAYLCPAGVPTIGWGHTAGVSIGQTITIAEAEALLARDLAAIGDHIESTVRLTLNDNEYAALVSLVFNIGSGNFSQSTVLRELQNNDRAAAAAAFSMWVKATVGGVKVTLTGLVRRRAAEASLFLTPLTDSGPMPQAVSA